MCVVKIESLLSLTIEWFYSRQAFFEQVYSVDYFAKICNIQYVDIALSEKYCLKLKSRGTSQPKKKYENFWIFKTRKILMGTSGFLNRFDKDRWTY